MKVGGGKLRILHFDMECRPLSWYGGDFVTKEVTAIAWGWADKAKIDVRLLYPWDPEIDYEDFLAAYDAADIVTGHFIRGFDLPLLNSLLSEAGVPPLKPKLTSDTKLDLIKRHGMSNSQENLAAEFRIPAPKVKMTQAEWREANRLTNRGLELTYRRVKGDVKQHKALRAALLDRGLLGPPKRWSSLPSGRGKYHG